MDRNPDDDALRAILNALPALVAYWDRDLRNRIANDAYIEYFGRTPEEMRGMHISEVLGPDLYARNLPYMQRALAGEAQTFDREIPTPSGELRYTQASYLPDVRDGEVHGFFVLVTDISDRRRAELALAASEQRYRTLVDHLPGSAVSLVDRDLRLIWLGGGAITGAGVDPTTMIGRPVAETSGGGEHGQRVAGLYARALAGETVSAELHSKVTGLDFAIDIVPLRDETGAVTAALGVAQDVSERLRAEADVRLRSQIAEHMAEGAILVRAADLVIVEANPTVERMFGYEPGELEGRHLSVLDAPAAGDPEAIAANVARAFDETGAWTGELRSIRKDGSLFWRRLTISQFEHPEHGRLLIAVTSDVTEQHERQAEQAALARITRLVAEGVAPEALFGAVAREVGDVLGAAGSAVVRVEATSPLVEIVGAAAAHDLGGEHLDLRGDGAIAEACRTRRAARREDGRGGTRVAVPISVDGMVWGAIAVTYDAPPPSDAETRLRRIAGLTELALANAAARERLAREAATDALTRIANRRTLEDRLRMELTRARRYGRSLSLILVDVDHFKQINDRHGHQTGDDVLVALAQRLLVHARDSDLVARIGGEEFAWLMPETAADDAQRAAERLRADVGAAPLAGAVRVTVSAGVADTRAAATDESQLMRCADEALYAAKHAGRDAVRRWTPDRSGAAAG